MYLGGRDAIEAKKSLNSLLYLAHTLFVKLHSSKMYSSLKNNFPWAFGSLTKKMLVFNFADLSLADTSVSHGCYDRERPHLLPLHCSILAPPFHF